MASNRKNFFGIGLVPSSGTTNSVSGDTEYLSSDGKIHVFGVSANDAVVMEALACTLTNKTISGSTNTLTNIGNASLANSSVTINGSSVSLGGSVTVTATSTGTLTLGTGLTGTSYNGSTNVTAAIDTTVVATLTGTQTLTNKTLTTPTISTINSATSTNLVLNAPTGQTVNLDINATPSATVSATALTLATGNGLVLTNNSQTVTINASAAASASYTITTPAAAPTSNTALVYNGTNYVWATAGGWITSSQTSLTNGGTITISTTSGQQMIIVAGTSGAVTMATVPFSGTPTDGSSIRLICNSNTNTVSLVNSDTSGGAILNGPITLYKYNSIELQYSSTLARFVEISRNQ